MLLVMLGRLHMGLCIVDFSVGLCLRLFVNECPVSRSFMSYDLLMGGHFWILEAGGSCDV